MRKIEFVLESILEMPDDEARTLDREGVLALLAALPSEQQALFYDRLNKKMPFYNLLH